MIVWILVILGFPAPLVVDNIASRQDCLAVRDAIIQMRRYEVAPGLSGSGHYADPSQLKCISVRRPK